MLELGADRAGELLDACLMRYARLMHVAVYKNRLTYGKGPDLIPLSLCFALCSTRGNRIVCDLRPVDDWKQLHPSQRCELCASVLETFNPGVGFIWLDRN